MLNSRYNHCLVFDERHLKIYAFGGLNDTFTPGSKISNLDTTQDHDEGDEDGLLRSGEYYDIRDDIWVAIAKMPHHREQACATMFKSDSIYVFGGIDRFFPAQNLLNIIDKYSIS